MKFKTCYLHIGIEKTGSTSIQRFLEKNRSALARGGHYYPSCFGPYRGSHYYLVVYARHEDVIDDLRLISGVTNKQEVGEFREKLERKASGELASVDSCDFIHVSCENFHSRLLGTPAIERVKEFLAPWVEDFKVIAYFRPQHEVALSLYSTDMKLGGSKKPPLPEVGDNDHYYNYEIMLDKWAHVFGIENITVRNFQRHELHASDIIADYMQITGIHCEGLLPIPKENESLSPKALEFLARLNAYLPRFSDNMPAKVRKNIAEMLERNFPGKGATTSKLRAIKFYNKFKKSNERLARRYLGREQLFDVDFDKYPEQSPIEEFTLSDAFEILDKLLESGTFITERDRDFSETTKQLLSAEDPGILDLTRLYDFVDDTFTLDTFFYIFAEAWKASRYEVVETEKGKAKASGAVAGDSAQAC